MRNVYGLAIAGLCWMAAANAQAGSISPALQDRLDRVAAEEPVSVIVHLSEQAPIAQIKESLLQRRATRLERNREIILALQATRESQEPLQARLDEGIRAGRVQGYTSYWISNMLVVLATRDEIFQIAARSDVDLVEPNFTPVLIEPVERGIEGQGSDELSGPRGIGVPPGVRAVRAPEVWYQLGYTGEGRVLANLDTGVDGNHPALAARWRGAGGANPWQECWLDVLGGNTQFPVDNNSHGTHVMGTITGNGAATEDTVGVAWGAQWIACNAINQGVGPGFDNDVITAFQWYMNPDGNLGTVDDVPDVVQNSWGVFEGLGYPDCDTRWWVVIDNCEAAGVVTTWSAGNEGPGGTSLRSPADRATTLFNTLSVGAVDATSFNFPYPIASFSSRGPTGCNVPPDHKIKPEVVAPGVSVYSSVPGGGYSQGFSGTSMAGPHVAGIVGLIRQANPDLDVDTIKQILMDTARDEGPIGEENTYGWGMVDAYEAVIGATVGFGQVRGFVRNESFNDLPIPGAKVRLLESGNQFTTDATGFYQGAAAAGTYTAEASHPSFEPETFTVVVEANEPVDQDFSLVDIAGPTISNVTDDETTTDTVGPYPISATVVDHSTVTSVKLFYRLNGGSWNEQPMSNGLGGSLYETSLPGFPTGTQIDYYLWAEDGIGLTSTNPADAPASFYSLYITNELYAYQAEDPNDPNWQLGAPGDGATTGLWIRADPVGTEEGGQPIQPEDDHTPNPGVKCFVTGNGPIGGGIGENDVDNGCTTLLSPIFDLSQATQGFVTYFRWYGEGGASSDDTFVIDVSSNGGTTWVPLERVVDIDNTWREVTVKFSDLVTLTSQVRFKFQACDLNTQGITEAGIDDFALETFVPNASAAPESNGPVLTSRLAQNEPNPTRTVTSIGFRLSNAAEARLEIFDTSGRLVRTLVNGPLPSGSHEIGWDGMDDQGRSAGSGVYFYRLKAGAFEQSRRMTVLR